MTRLTRIDHRFVDVIPSKLRHGILYLSIPYSTAVHSCGCGCGNEVVTPLTPTDWRMTYDGESVTLSPSVGNWSFDCRSHYVIDRGRLRWARGWAVREINEAREIDRVRKSDFFAQQTAVQERAKEHAAKSRTRQRRRQWLRWPRA